MTRYKLAQYARPLVLALFPLIIVFGFFVQWIGVVVVLIAGVTPLLWWLRCRSCSASIYFDDARPIRTFLAVPHRVCTKCGASNEI